MGACKTFARSGLGECGAAYALDLASRNDGYMVQARGNPTIEALRKAGLITTSKVDGDYLIARAIHIPKPGYHMGKPRLERAMQIGRGINLNRRDEEAFA